MKVKDKKWIRFRIYLVAFVIIIGLGTILARAYQLQVWERDKLKAMARADISGMIHLPPQRGSIYDREGHELAISVELGSIYAHPGLVKEKVSVSKKISKILNLSTKKVLSQLRSDSGFIWVERKVAPESAEKIKELKLLGVGVITEAGRFYPGREIAAHLIGFTGADNQGLEGLEKCYDQDLKGPPNTYIQKRDAIGRPFYLERYNTSKRKMHHLYLTIDKDIQYKAQQVLRVAVEKSKAKSGQCVVMDPNTGEILAMAVAPSFNPNIFWKYEPEQWRNRVITDCYEPGSTIKAFLLAAALEEGVVSPLTTFYCEQGKMKIAKHTVNDTKPYGYLTVAQIVAYSSNIGAIKIGQKLGYQKFYEYLQKFGFGEKTGLDTIGERTGYIRTISDTRPVDQATIYFGQGMSSSSIQLITAMSVIANGGKLVRPYLVRAVKDQNGHITKSNTPYVVRRVLSPSVAKRVTRILEGVVTEKGTAPKAAIEGFQVAGKTGTSQKIDQRTKAYSNHDYIALFIGFVPANNPKLAILVMVDEPRGNPYGGLVAGPVFSELGAWALNNLNIHPSLQFAGKLKNIESFKTSKSQEEISTQILPDNGLLPNFTGESMREVLRKSRALGLKVVLEGTGLAINQVPQPGSPLEEVSMVKVKFKPPG